MPERPDPTNERGARPAAKPAAATGRASGGYATVPFSDLRRNGVDWNELMNRRHAIHGLVEFDITRARREVHQWRSRMHAPLSFTALVTASFARSIAANPEVQAFRKGRSRLVLFDEVDVTVLVEHTVDGARIPMPHIIRSADRKTPAEIDREIRAAVGEPQPYARARSLGRAWLVLPAFLRRFLLSAWLADPHRRKRLTGTATLTAVSMFGSGTGWGIPFTSHSIGLTVGGIARRPGLAPDGSATVRDVICLTVSVDHDVVDGAPVARFIARLKDSLESAEPLRGDEPGGATRD